MALEALPGLRHRIAAAAERVGRRAEDVRLVAVTKGLPVDVVRMAIAAGLTDLAENYLREARSKIELVKLENPAVRWHMTGHLQSNKAAEALHLFDMIQTVDSLALLRRLDRLAVSAVPVLIQVRLGGEAHKSGVDPQDLGDLLTAASGLSHIGVRGLMAIPPPVNEAEDNREHFRTLSNLARQYELAETSMGMSDDFEVAIEEGATMIRIGTALFGSRLV